LSRIRAYSLKEHVARGARRGDAAGKPAGPLLQVVRQGPDSCSRWCAGAPGGWRCARARARARAPREVLRCAPYLTRARPTPAAAVAGIYLAHREKKRMQGASAPDVIKAQKGQDIMRKRAHGTCLGPVQTPLRWNSDWETVRAALRVAMLMGTCARAPCSGCGVAGLAAAVCSSAEACSSARAGCRHRRAAPREERAHARMGCECDVRRRTRLVASTGTGLRDRGTGRRPPFLRRRAGTQRSSRA